MSEPNSDASSVLAQRLNPHVGLVTLNRPNKLNAFTWGMATSLTEAMTDLDTDPDIRAVILTGAGRGFCAGIDLTASGRDDFRVDKDPVAGHFDWLDRVLGDVIRTIDQMRTPVICAVNGVGVGLGFSLALVADIRVMARSASLADGYIGIGASGAELGTSYFLPRLVGLNAASELLLTNRRIGADEAKEMGLTRHVVDDDELLARATEIADQIAQHHTWAVEMTKEVLRINVSAPNLQAAMALEHRTQILSGRTADGAEARAAKVERRRPNFIKAKEDK